MSRVPHPLVTHSMLRFGGLSDTDKAKVRFIHMNHTNPLLAPGARERDAVKKTGFHIAEEGAEICL